MSLTTLTAILWDNTLSLVPIVVLLAFFQTVVIRKPLPELRRIVAGFALVVAGMVLFLAGLDLALFPLGRVMAEQLTSPEFLGVSALESPAWQRYWAVYVFGGLIGFATTIAEPALIAVSMKAETVSGGTVQAWGLRLVVAIGVAIGIALGTFRIVTGTPLPAYIIAGYVVVMLQATRAPRTILALAFDTGGVTTSTVTVPLVTALGLGLASTIPGRSALIDGFGLIAFASLFPMMTVMGYAQIGARRARRQAPAAAQHQRRGPDPVQPTRKEI